MEGHRSAVVDEMVRLHFEEGLSTSQIATRLHMKKNSVLVSLRNRGVLRKALGVDIEEQVAKWYEKQGFTIKRQRGDAPYDLLVANERIDVKSANACYSMNHGKIYGKYHFDIQHRNSMQKDLGKELDWFLLVFLDRDGKPMYKVRSSDIADLTSLSIPESFNTKHNLSFVGDLEG